MEKSPAFQWYPKDFDTDENVILMTLEEIGAYVKLMNSEWLHKGLPMADEDLAIISRLGEKWNTSSGEKIKKCFKKKGKRLIHPRLEKERKKQAEWRLKSSAGGKKSASMRKESKKEPTTLEPPLKEKGNQSPTLLSSFPSSSTSSLKDLKTYVEWLFNSFWLDYPRKYGKDKAKKKFIKDITTEAIYNNLRTALSNYKKDIKINKTENQFIKHGSTFMNNWQEWLEWVKPKAVGHGSVNDKDYGDSGIDGTNF